MGTPAARAKRLDPQSCRLPTREAALAVAAFEVGEGLPPGAAGSLPAGCSRVEVSLLEVDPAVAPRDARLVGGLAEGRPGEREVAGRDGARLEARAAGGEGHRGSEDVAAGEEAQDLCARGAEVAVP